MPPPNNKDAKSLLNGHADEVIAAVTSDKSPFISPERLAAKLDVTADAVRGFLDARTDIVRRADVKDRQGKTLYALASRPLALVERWGRLYSYINKEPLPSYRPDHNN